MSRSIKDREMQDAVSDILDMFHEKKFITEEIMTVLNYTSAVYMAHGIEHTVDMQGHSDNVNEMILEISKRTKENMSKTLTFIMDREMEIRSTMH